MNLSANDYPYNLQGDQTKARQLAAQAQSGDAGALQSLRQLGLDAGGNLATAGAATPVSTPSPAVSTPSLPPTQGTMREPITRQASPAYGSARNPMPLDPFKAQEPFVNPATQLQRDRLTLDQAKFADAQKRYTDQQAAAAQRVQQQQQQASSSRSAPQISTPPSTPPGTPVSGIGGGGGNSAMQPKNAITTPPKQTAAPAKKSSGGGGGGGGGGLSPEQKARNKAREGRQTERENDRARKMEDWNKTPEQKARKAKTASDYYAIRDADKRAARGEDVVPQMQATDRSKPVKNPYTDGPQEFSNADEYEKYMRDRLAKERERMKEAERKDQERMAAENDSGGQPKMVQAWGNKHSTVWVKARGDK
jgi:hypothetical protein